MPGPHEVRVILLLTCTNCGGEGYYDTEDDGPCNCPRCIEGRQAAAVPLAAVLRAFRPGNSEAHAYTELAQVVREAEPTGHPLVNFMADDLPPAALERLRQKSTLL